MIFHPPYSTAEQDMKWGLIIALCLLPGVLCAQNLILEISGIRTTEGHIQLMFYQSEKNYQNDTPDIIKRYPKHGMSEGRLTISETLAPGVYGIILMDDVTDSEVMEFSFLGLPKKGFGFAGFLHKGIKRPRFSDFSFTLKTTRVKKEIRVKYF